MQDVFLPIEVGKIDLFKLKEDVLNLWAEAVFLYKQDRQVELTLSPKLSGEIEKAHETFKREDALSEDIAEMLADPHTLLAKELKEHDSIRLSTVWKELNKFSIGAPPIKRSFQMRLANCLKSLGFSRSCQRRGTEILKVWKRELTNS